MRHAAAILQGVRQVSDSMHAEATSTSETMPADGWLCELTLESGLDADVRGCLTSTTPWRVSDKGIVSVSLDEYLQLLDWTGRKLASGKRESIPAELAPILERLAIHAPAWLDAIEHFDKKFGKIVASVSAMAKKAAEVGRRWFRGVGVAAEVFH